jgi:D-glycero-D-manno-heptose 1,7-bisphosphate phosphatase
MSETRQAVILAGGRGSRLGALTEATPKPLLPVAGRPFLLHLLERLAAQGFTEVRLLTGYLAGSFNSVRAAGRALGLDVTCHVEDEPAGTGGALALAAPFLAPQFLLLNGDSLFDIDMGSLADPPLPPGCLGRMALRRVERLDRYGAVELADGRVTSFAVAGDPVRPGLINAGIYWLDRRLAEGIPPGMVSLEADILPGLTRDGKLQGRACEGYFIDIGIPADYAQAQAELR